MEDLEGFLIVAGLINLFIIYLFFSVLSAIRKESTRTNYLLHKIFKQNGGKLTEEDIDFLSK